jgi:hypothetical protein
MADYYHEARKAKRALKDVAMDNKRRREQRREEGREPDDTEHPLNLLQVAGRASKLHRNAEQHAALERQDGLIPWNGDTANLMDRCGCNVMAAAWCLYCFSASLRGVP